MVIPRSGREIMSLSSWVVTFAPITMPRARPASVGRLRATATSATTTPATTMAGTDTTPVTTEVKETRRPVARMVASMSRVSSTCPAAVDIAA